MSSGRLNYLLDKLFKILYNKINNLKSNENKNFRDRQQSKI